MTNQQTYTLPELGGWIENGGRVRRASWPECRQNWRQGMSPGFTQTNIIDDRGVSVCAPMSDITADDWMRVEE